MTTEVNYLILFNKKKNQFSGIENFQKLLGILKGVELSENAIKFEESEFTFNLIDEGDRYPDHDTELFDLVLVSKKNEKDVNHLSSLLREIKRAVSSQYGTMTPVFDGISGYYAEKAYPEIHYIENLMRKLFSKYALINLGPKWVETLPEGVPGIPLKAETNGNNPLYNIDFIKINDILFKEHAAKEADAEVLRKIRDGEITGEGVEPYVPRSHWSRHFSDLVDCESNYLEKKWKKLYTLRNKIAHNKEFTKTDLSNVKKITSELKDKLVPAISKISTIKVEAIDISYSDKINEVVEGELCVAEGEATYSADNKNGVEEVKESDGSGILAFALIVGLLSGISK
ncbi:hypothetical protein MACH09_42130 [Vibrio sp. MACH09]|uniref:HEPN domain-containing protein n=1 Tax=Vibrio sp. MACH09 TaxID=3025122 RepID=UPI002791EC8D|nr:HEPN domain-containing protein [Vibrio sp. MACH09]GLO63705.1 hypothetical protein MACH09_42130 [Vibrio sp. MACH09]